MLCAGLFATNKKFSLQRCCWKLPNRPVFDSSLQCNQMAVGTKRHSRQPCKYLYNQRCACMVTSLSSIMTSFVKKSAPMVAFFWNGKPGQVLHAHNWKDITAGETIFLNVPLSHCALLVLVGELFVDILVHQRCLAHPATRLPSLTWESLVSMVPTKSLVWSRRRKTGKTKDLMNRNASYTDMFTACESCNDAHTFRSAFCVCEENLQIFAAHLVVVLLCS